MSIDEKKYEEYLDTLEVIRPDLFIDEEDNYVEPSAINALVPTGLMDVVPSDDPRDLIAQPEVETILLPNDNTLPAIILAEPYSVPQKERTFAPPMDEDDDIDFVISKPDKLTVSLPIELDIDKILLTDDGDVELIEPDNMQVEEGPLYL